MYHINQCINPRLASLCKKAIELESIHVKLIQYLPENLRDYFSVASFNNGSLVLNTTDPVWGTQLRYHLPELRDKLRKEEKLYQLVSIKIKIVMPEYKQPKVSAEKKSSSPSTAQQALSELKEALHHASTG